MVLLPLSINHGIQMLGQNQGMGRRFIVLTFSNYLVCKKKSKRWYELLKPHYQPLETILLQYMDIFTTSF